jgi:hypothetical protein
VRHAAPPQNIAMTAMSEYFEAQNCRSGKFAFVHHLEWF